MPLDINNFERLLPSYLREEGKHRLRKALEQFSPNRGEVGLENLSQSKESIDYSNFFSDISPNYFMQGDMLNSVRIVDWDEEIDDYYSGFSSVMLISNTCDVTQENERSLNYKQSLLAPVISVEEYFADLEDTGYSVDKIKSYHTSLKKQEISNLIYIPRNDINGKEYIVFLDKIIWHPSKTLQKQVKNLEDSRFISLSNFGFYLVILKISYHLCRLPEEVDR